jgi:mono/diheme cytochrome c family protein
MPTVRFNFRMSRQARPSLKRLAVLSALSIAAHVGPGWAADSATGRELSQRWCASCHVVALGQSQAAADVLSFAEIARKPGFEPNALAYFLLEPHPKMPNMSLTRAEAANIAAYIATLRR